MAIFISIVLLAVICVYLFLHSMQFGAAPSNGRLQRIRQSPNYRDGVFHNTRKTVMMSPDASFFKILRKFLSKMPGREPASVLPSVPTDLKHLRSDKPVIVWFGHSSYLIRINGKNILVDPVLSGNAAPVSWFTKNYKGSNIFKVEDLPALDMVILTHDHYDHLDYRTVVKLKAKTKHFYTSLGVGAHLNRWGISDAHITEFDWWDKVAVDADTKLIAVPGAHFSGRSFRRGNTLWASYILKSGNYSLFLGGDSGYYTHFKEIGEKFGPFDIALLECGQYNTFWPDIHMMPEQTVHAAIDLKAKVLMPVHWAKFSLAMHPWQEPAERVTKAAANLHQPITTPMIGEPVVLDESYPSAKWWEGVK